MHLYAHPLHLTYPVMCRGDSRAGRTWVVSLMGSLSLLRHQCESVHDVINKNAPRKQESNFTLMINNVALYSHLKEIMKEKEWIQGYKRNRKHCFLPHS